MKNKIKGTFESEPAGSPKTCVKSEHEPDLSNQVFFFFDFFLPTFSNKCFCTTYSKYLILLLNWPRLFIGKGHFFSDF